MSLLDLGGDQVELPADRGAVLEVGGVVPVLTGLENISQQGGHPGHVASSDTVQQGHLGQAGSQTS